MPTNQTFAYTQQPLAEGLSSNRYYIQSQDNSRDQICRFQELKSRKMPCNMYKPQAGSLVKCAYSFSDVAPPLPRGDIISTSLVIFGYLYIYLFLLVPSLPTSINPKLGFSSFGARLEMELTTCSEVSCSLAWVKKYYPQLKPEGVVDLLLRARVCRKEARQYRSQ